MIKNTHTHTLDPNVVLLCSNQVLNEFPKSSSILKVFPKRVPYALRNIV